jgi:hypothetical protein
MGFLGTFAGASSRAYGLQAGGLLGDFESIATITVTGATQADIEFTSIPQTYRHLQIRYIGRDNSATTDKNVELQFNSDTGSNYSQHGMYSNNTSTPGGFGNLNQTNILAGRVTGASSTANIFGCCVVDILDYTNTNKYKTTRTLTSNDQNGSGYVFFESGNWRSTSAITSIKLKPADGNSWVTNSTFALYGIKG